MEQNSETNSYIYGNNQNKGKNSIKLTIVYNIYNQTHTHTQNTINKINKPAIN